MLREVKDRDEGDEEEATAREGLPLAFNQHGDPVDVPDEAAGWRIRRHKVGDRGGAPELVYENARPLVLELEATADDLIERVGGKAGRYRLDPVDAAGRPIRGAGAAYALVERAAVAVPESRGPDELTTRLLIAVEQLVKSQSEANAAMTSQMSQVIGAMSNAVVPPDKRRPIEYVQVAAPPAAQSSSGGFDWETFMTTMAPALQGVIGTLIQRLMAAPPTPAAQGLGG